MTAVFRIGDRVRIRLDSKFGDREGWYEGSIFKIEAYSEHRSFYWVRLDEEAQAILKVRDISVFNLKNIQSADEPQISNS